MRRATRHVFGQVFNHYLGDGALIMEGEAPDGSNIEFSATGKWLEENHVTKFQLTYEALQVSLGHIRSCQSVICVEARQMTEIATEVRRTGLSDELALVSAFLGGMSDLIVSRETGFGEAIDGLKPLILWFQRDQTSIPTRA